jgi:hypothetical protein
MNIIDRIKSFFTKDRSIKRKNYANLDPDTPPPSRINKSRRQNNKVDLTFPKTVNTCLTKNLYYNRDPLTKLGAHFARNIINIPLAFMGFPHFYTTRKVQKFWQDVFTYYNDKSIKIKQDIQRESSRDGTTWIFPRFDIETDWVEWDFLGQASRFFYNSETRKMTAIEFDDQILIQDSVGSTKSITETTRYTKTEIVLTRDGVKTVRRNPTGELPINFVNNGEAGDPEGNSDLEVVYPRIQLYSQLDKKKNEVLLNHDPKWIQYVSDVTQWRTNNGLSEEDLARFDIEGSDFILNLFDKEKTEYIIPAEIIDAYEKALKTNFHNIVEGSEIPEIVMGLKTEGNHASAEEQIAVFVAFVNMKRNGIKSAYDKLINITFRLMGEAFFKRFNFEIEQTWSDLEMLSRVEKSTLFNNYATGIQKLKSSGLMGKSGTHKILRGVMGDEIIDEFDEFVKDIEEEKKSNPPATPAQGEPEEAEDNPGD